ncbi:hypothetical protein B484DRAFT_402720 [Ochromonadaceae sp. CCMP2298]|nr:hypothetical protein B484DRAFT_402720 [Ochromonadaceae sp. CCMP2298]
MVCFVRVSDWSLPTPEDKYDEQAEGELHMVVKGIVTLVGAAEAVAGKTAQLLKQVVAPPTLILGRGRAKRRRSMTRSLSGVGANGAEVRNLVLTRNELDCGDAVYAADILTHQLHLVFVDFSYNRIGARGMNRYIYCVY